MSLHSLGLLVFILLTVVLALLFAAGLCERELRRTEMQDHAHKGCAPTSLR